MKVRSGFVSNSSTTSFALIGWKLPLPKTPAGLWELLHKLGYTPKPPLPDTWCLDDSAEDYSDLEENSRIFEIINHFRFSNRKGWSVRVGIQTWDGGPGVDDGKMLIGVESCEDCDGRPLEEVAEQINALREKLGKSDKEMGGLRVFVDRAEQGT
jgi:hypothetical protein